MAMVNVVRRKWQHQQRLQSHQQHHHYIRLDKNLSAKWFGTILDSVYDEHGAEQLLLVYVITIMYGGKCVCLEECLYISVPSLPPFSHNQLVIDR